MDKREKAEQVRRVPFWRALQTKYALTYLVIVAAVVVQAVPSAEPTPQTSPEAAAPSTEGKIDLNTATKEELMTLPGIGEGILEGLIDLVPVS